MDTHDPLSEGSILATAAQREVEQLALWLTEQPAARRERERARDILLQDPVAQTADGRALLERALDEWVMFLAMRVANSDADRPLVIWGADNTARAWFGHVFPGALAAIENPDNTNREMRIDGGAVYELYGRFGRDPASFSLTMETMEGYHLGIGTHVDALPGGTIQSDTDGQFTVSIDASPASGRRNHLQTVPGPLMLYARDSQFDWDQDIARLAIRKLGAAAAPPRSRATLLDEFAAHIYVWVKYWCGFKDTFLEHPEPNIIVGPRGREGGWGFLAGGRFALADDEAIMITTNESGAGYTGFQVADPWTMSPNPSTRTVSLNKTQAKPNSDGSYTYVVALVDPGVSNWVDTAGLHLGWLLLRWQAVPATADATTFIRDVRHLKLSELDAALPPGMPRATLQSRAEDIALRMRGRARRLE